MKTIGVWAFKDCIELTSITCLASTPPYYGYVWDEENYANATLYVPEDAITAYQEAGYWCNFTNIKAIETSGIEEPKVVENGKPIVIYDLRGRRLREKQKGLNIINGKKVFVR